MNLLKKLFVKKPRIYFIEINDEDIDKQLSSTLSKLRGELDTFRSTLHTDTLEGKEQELSKLQQIILEVKNKLSSIASDVDRIMNIELQNSSFFAIKDSDFLTDKKAQIDKMMMEINSFLTIVEQRPSKDALEEELLNELEGAASRLIKNLELIIADDSQLKSIYKKINNL